MSGEEQGSDQLGRLERAASYAEIVELLARYATIIDSRDWNALGEIFTPEATFDASSAGYPVLDGLEDIKRHMATDARHPAAHLILNVVAEISTNRASVSSRLAALQSDGRIFTGEYRDELTRTDLGWRISARVYNRLQHPSDPSLPASRLS
jgi:hypothetical protein